MKGFQDLTRTVDLYGPDIRLNFELQDILDKAKDIAYVYKYPPSWIYHNTHDGVVTHAKRENLIDVQQALNRIEYNVEWLYDWSTDMENWKLTFA